MSEYEMDRITEAAQCCPKCLTPDVDMRWQAEIDEEEAERRARLTGGPALTLPELVRMKCRRCGHIWMMRPADAAERGQE